MNDFFKYLFVSLIICVPIFFCLDKAPIRLWDESRLAINAIEMSQSDNYIVTTFDQEPDMWNTKPPLLIWMQALLIKLLGVHPIAIRIPTAIAGFLTCIILFGFFGRAVKSYLLGLIVVLILVTTQGYIGDHVVRTGDYDSLLVLYMLLYSLCYFYFWEKMEIRYLYGFFIFASMAVLTKGIAGLMFMPALFLYTLFNKKCIVLFKNKHLYIAIITFLIPVMLYYTVREWHNPGYIHQVMLNEIGGRYLETLENHKHPFDYYLNNLYTIRYSYWIFTLLLGFGMMFTLQNNILKRLAIFSAIIVFSYFLIISMAATKLQWYDAPLFPFMAIVSGLGIYSIYTYVCKHINKLSPRLSFLFSILFMMLLFMLPYINIVKKIYYAQELPEEKEYYALSNYLREGMHGIHSIQNKYVVSNEYIPHVEFYVYMAANNGFNVRKKQAIHIKNGDELIIHDEATKSYIQKRFHFDALHQSGNVMVIKILDKLS